MRVEALSDSVADSDAEEVEAEADDSVPVIVVLLLTPVGRVADVEVPKPEDTLVEDRLPVMITVEVWVVTLVEVDDDDMEVAVLEKKPEEGLVTVLKDIP